VSKQTFTWITALAAMLLAGSATAPGAVAQTYPYPQGYQGYPQGYYPPDPYGQYYGYGSYGPPPYGQGYGPYGYGGYGAPPAYTGYGSAYGPYYGAPYQAPGYYGQNPAYPPPNSAYPPPNYYGGYPPPYQGQPYYNPSQMPPPLGLPYAPPPTTSDNGFLLTATVTGPNAATLTWNAVPGAVSYAIYQSVNGGPLQFSSTSTSPGANVPLGMGTYAFQVHALGSGGSDLLLSNVATPTQGSPLGPAAPQGYQTGPGVPSPSNSSVTANVQQGSLFIGTQITVTVLDSGRMPVSGHLVSLVSSRGIDNVMPANGTTPVTDGSGRAYFNVRPGQPGQANFTAYVDGNIQIGQTVVNFQ